MSVKVWEIRKQWYFGSTVSKYLRQQDPITLGPGAGYLGYVYQSGLLASLYLPEQINTFPLPNILSFLYFLGKIWKFFIVIVVVLAGRRLESTSKVFYYINQQGYIERENFCGTWMSHLWQTVNGKNPT